MVRLSIAYNRMLWFYVVDYTGLIMVCAWLLNFRKDLKQYYTVWWLHALFYLWWSICNALVYSLQKVKIKGYTCNMKLLHVTIGYKSDFLIVTKL